MYKIKLNSDKFSFDYDGTLDDDFDGSINKQKLEIQKICKYYVDLGKDVYIITKRYDSNNKNNGIGNEHIKVYDMAKKLGVKNVHFTNRDYKNDIIDKLGIDVHFENSEYESYLIKNMTKCMVVHIEDKYWRDLVY